MPNNIKKRASYENPVATLGRPLFMQDSSLGIHKRRLNLLILRFLFKKGIGLRKMKGNVAGAMCIGSTFISEGTHLDWAH